MPMSSAVSEKPGQLAWFPRLTAPDGWVKANGASLPQASYGALFSEIGFSLGWEGSDASTSMSVAGVFGVMVTLADGRLLYIGGSQSGAPVANTWIGTVSGNAIAWAASTALPGARRLHAAVVLTDGRVLVAGGNSGSTNEAHTWIGTVSGNAVAWAASTALPGGRQGHAMVRLLDGRVLVAGGDNAGGATVATVYIGTVSGDAIAWVTSTDMPAARYGMGASVFDDGSVFVTGGYNAGVKNTAYLGVVSGDAVSWSVVSVLPNVRAYHQQVRASDGRAIIFSGYDGSTNPVDSYVVTRTAAGVSYFTAGSVPVSRYGAGCSVLADGRICYARGSYSGTDKAEVYLFADSFYIPDVRGEFVRGLDDGRGVDSARVLGSAQSGQNLSHTHSVTGTAATYGKATGAGASLWDQGEMASATTLPVTGTAAADGGTEARPRNVALLGCIKY